MLSCWTLFCKVVENASPRLVYMLAGIGDLSLHVQIPNGASGPFLLVVNYLNFVHIVAMLLLVVAP